MTSLEKCNREMLEKLLAKCNEWISEVESIRSAIQDHLKAWQVSMTLAAREEVKIPSGCSLSDAIEIVYGSLAGDIDALRAFRSRKSQDTESQSAKQDPRQDWKVAADYVQSFFPNAVGRLASETGEIAYIVTADINGRRVNLSRDSCPGMAAAWIKAYETVLGFVGFYRENVKR